MKDIEITAVSNKIVLSRSNFNAFHKKILGAIVDTISPNIFNELEKHKEFSKSDKLLLATKGLEKSYQLGAFNMASIVYKASDLCRPDQYEELREALSQLRKKDFVMITDDEHYESSLILKFKFDKREEYLNLGIDEELYKILFDLTAGYTLYQTKVLLSFSSIYTMRIYEILAKWRNKEVFEISLEELRRLTDTINKYSDTNDFKKRVLDSAKQQLDESEITDLRFDYSERKTGKKIIGFKIRVYKTDMSHEVKQRASQVSLYWDFSKSVIDNFKKYDLILKGKNLELVKALVNVVGEQKMSLEMDMIFEKAKDTPNPQAYMIQSLKNYLQNATKEAIDLTIGERKKHAENARKSDTDNSPKSFGDLFKTFSEH